MSEETVFDALVVDTCVMRSKAFKFDSGLLSQLKQFESMPQTLMTVNVLNEELKKKIREQVSSSNESLRSAIQGARDTYLSDEQHSTVSEVILDTTAVDDYANGKVDRFILECGADEIKAGDYTSIERVFDAYVRHAPPFNNGKKQKEFPDALALFSVEEWARQGNKHVLVVSEDGDWRNYCESSQFLTCYRDLAAALSRFQSVERADYCKHAFKSFLNHGNAEDLLESIADKFKDELGVGDALIEADSYLYWESSGYEIGDSQANFDREEDECRLDIISSDRDELTVRMFANIDFELTAYFEFEKHDREGTYNVGSASVTKGFNEHVQVLVYCNLDGGDISFHDLEIETNPAGFGFHMGEIEPDFD